MGETDDYFSRMLAVDGRPSDNMSIAAILSSISSDFSPKFSAYSFMLKSYVYEYCMARTIIDEELFLAKWERLAELLIKEASSVAEWQSAVDIAPPGSKLKIRGLVEIERFQLHPAA